MILVAVIDAYHRPLQIEESFRIVHHPEAHFQTDGGGSIPFGRSGGWARAGRPAGPGSGSPTVRD